MIDVCNVGGVLLLGRFGQVVPRRANSQLHCFSEDYEAVAYSTYGDAAWAYVKERTGTDLFGILTELAAERSGRHE